MSWRQRRKNTKTAWTDGLTCPVQAMASQTIPMATNETLADRPAGYDDSIDAKQFADEWDDFLRVESPFIVFDERGEFEQRTGHTYHRCTACSAEMMSGRAKQEGFLHYRGCPIPNNPAERVNEHSTLVHRESSISMEGCR